MVGIEISRATVKIAGFTRLSGWNRTSWQTCTGASGGTQLEDHGGTILLQALPTNIGNIHIGGLTTEAPFASGGFVLTPGSALELHIESTNQLRAFAVISGDKVTSFGGNP